MSKRTKISPETKIEVVKTVIAPALKSGKRFEEIDVDSVKEIISSTNQQSPGDQIRSCYQAVIQLFKTEGTPFYNQKNADYLDGLRKKIHKKTGIKSIASDKAKEIADSFLVDLVESED